MQSYITVLSREDVGRKWANEHGHTDANYCDNSFASYKQRISKVMQYRSMELSLTRSSDFIKIFI